MNIVFYSDKKRGNSTYRPDEGGVRKNCRLKGATSVEAPLIIIDEPCEEIYTIAHIPAWHRWYAVTSVSSLTADTTAYQLNIDTLATYRDDILATTTWVERSASLIDLNQYDGMWTHNGSIVETNEKNIDIFGNRVTNTIKDLIHQIPGFENLEIPDMWYVVSVVNGENSIEGVTRYLMNTLEMKRMIETLFDPSSYSELTLTSEIQTYFNPFQYVVDVRAYPFAPSFTSRHAPVKFGWWEAPGIEATGVVGVYGEHFEYDFTPGGTYANFTNRSPEWTRLTGYCPGIGDYEIDSSYYGKVLHGHLYCDYTSGDAYFRLTHSGSLVLSRTGKIGASVQLSQLSTDAMQINEDKYQNSTGALMDVLGGLGEIGGGLLTGDVGDMIGGVGSIVGTSHKNTLREMQLKKDTCSPALSLTGSWNNVYPNCILNTAEWHCFYYVPEHKPTREVGGVANQRAKLGDLTGFTKIANGALDINATYSEKMALQALLEGGFFIE